MVNLSLIGLGIIIVSWLIQFGYMLKGQKKIKANFVIVYILGVLVLVYDGFVNGLINLAIANILSGIAALLVLIKIKLK
ncbi:hypothetical protein J4405_04380 [Candidatus Woesearchaeota archaeon]|nr:hypothetical protein [Candidatus Woesearchaeota archaeon]